jgi:uncharacterized protein (DUF2461 family)
MSVVDGSLASMVAAFKGWPEEAYDLLLKLEGEPSPAYLNRHREQRVRLVRDPMDQLCAALDGLERYGEPHVWNLHKNPWLWQHQCADLWMGRRVRMFLRFDLDGITVEGGWSGGGEPGQIARYRDAVATDETGEELAAILDDVAEAGYAPIDTPMRRTPRGYPADHRRADLLKRRGLVFRRELGADPWLHTEAAFDHVQAGLEQLLPLNEWCLAHVSVAGFARAD